MFSDPSGKAARDNYATAQRVTRLASWDQVSLPDEMLDSIRELIGRARDQGALRPDFTVSDLALLLWSFAPVIDATADTAPELEGRELLRRYGRDPRRPEWVDSERGVASATASGDSNGQAPERRPRRRHQSVCATCGQTAETTFRPDPTRPVYCDGCYHDVRETRRAAVASPAV